MCRGREVVNRQLDVWVCRPRGCEVEPNGKTSHVQLLAQWGILTPACENPFVLYLCHHFDFLEPAANAPAGLRTGPVV
jgi:hypothetical protein